MPSVSRMGNPETCPPTIPVEIWVSHAACFGKDVDFPTAWKKHLELKETYVQDENFRFLKDEDGNWLRRKDLMEDKL